MAKINWSDTDFPEGIYLVEVRKATEKPSNNSGDLMFAVQFEAVDFGMKEICADNIMLEGNGRGVGKAKLTALGFTGTEDEIFAYELMEKRAYVNLAAQSYMNPKNGQTYVSLKPTKCEGAPVGYWSVNAKPEGVKTPPEFDKLSESPF